MNARSSVTAMGRPVAALRPTLPIAWATVDQVADEDGKTIVGAIVTLTDKRGVSESVYSNDKGRFRLATALDGELDFWVRKRYHRDDTRKLALPAEATTSVKVTLAALKDAKAISDDHPPLSHFSRIALPRTRGRCSRGPTSRATACPATPWASASRARSSARARVVRGLCALAVQRLGSARRA